jgi:hypothetical protein
MKKKVHLQIGKQYRNFQDQEVNIVNIETQFGFLYFVDQNNFRYQYNGKFSMAPEGVLSGHMTNKELKGYDIAYEA